VKKRVLKISIGVVLALAAVLTGAFLYISSGHFIKTHVLPRVAKSIGCDVQTDEVDFSALSSIEFRNLRIGSEADPLMQAGTIRLRYRAWSFLSGKVEVDEVFLDHVRIAATPAKLEAMAKPEAPSEKKQGKASESKKLPELLVQDVRVNDLSLNYTQDGADPIELKLSNLSLQLPELASGKDFHLTVFALAQAKAGEQIDAEVKEINLNLGGTLGQNTMPTTLTLKVDVKGLAGTAGPVLLDGRSVQVAAEVTGGPANYALREFSAVEYVGDIKDAALEANGSLGVNPSSAVLDLMLDIAPDSLLNVIGTLFGNLDFGQTAVAYSGHVEFTSGERLATRGELQVSNLTVAAPGIPALRPMQVSVQHDLAVDLAGKTITLSRLDAKVADGNRDVVDIKLDRAVALDLQNSGSDASANISVRVDRFDLTLLNAFLAERPDVRILSGELNRTVKVSIENGGRQIALDIGGGGIDRLLVQQGERRIGPLRIDHEAQLQLIDFSALHIDHFQVDVIPLTTGPAPAATAVLGGDLTFGEQPAGTLTARLSGQGQKLAFLAKPFLDDRALAYLQPMLSGNVALDMNALLQASLDNGTVQLEECRIQIDGLGREHLVDVAVEKTSFTLEEIRRGDEKVRIPLRVAVNDLQLARLLPFLPYETQIARLSGNLNLNGHVLLTGPAKGMNLETSASIENVLFVLKDGTALSAPVTPSLDLSLDYTAGGTARIERMNAVLHQAGRQEPLLDLEIAGRFDTSMDPSVRNVVDISTRAPVMLDALEKLIVTPEKHSQPTPQPAPETAAKTSTPPSLWVGISIAVDEAIYGDLRIKNLGAEAECRGGKVELSKAEALVNEGTLSANGVCDLSNPEAPQYDFKINGRNLQFAPVLATFIPHAALHTRGGMKDVEIVVKGTGFDLASMQENLEAQVDVQLDQLVIERMSGTGGKLTEALLLGMFNLNWSDLSFMAGGLDLAIDPSRFGDHDIHIQTLLLQAPAFQLDGSGSVQFGGAWAPDMEIKTGFIGAKADSLRRHGYAISTQADGAGYYPGPAIPLKGDLTSHRNQASLVTEVLVRSGKLSKKDARKADLVNQILGSLGGDQKNGEKKTDVGGILGGILGGVLESQSPEENQTEGQNDDPTEAIGNLLQRLFGN
jgi:hypothetical protein